MKNILKEVLSEIKPSKKEEQEVMKKISTFISSLNKKLKGAKAILGGSRAKGTAIRGKYDVDIFVKYDYKKFKDKSSELSEMLQKSLKQAGFKFERLHGSRDYFQVEVEKYLFEIVPILGIKKASQAVNITDISPLHTRFVVKNKKFQDDSRLTKQFCRAANIYGAESYLQGFSGYVLEILIVAHGGFENLVKRAARWKGKHVVDMYKTHKDVYMEMNTSKLVSPLIVVDPVDPRRNAAAAISEKKYNKFVLWCEKFVEKPSKSFFEAKPIDEKMLRKEFAGKNIVIIKAAAQDGKRDVVGAKLRKVFEFIEQKICDYGVIDSDWALDEENNSYMWFVLQKKEIDKLEKRSGPPIGLKEFVVDFKKTHKKTFMEKGKIFAYVERDYTKAEDLVKSLLKEKYVKERVKSAAVV